MCRSESRMEWEGVRDVEPGRIGSFGLRFYLTLSNRAGSLGRYLLRKRLKEGREDPDRFLERMGQPGILRPQGPVIWFHAASVGESVSLLELFRRLGESRPDVTCLVTSGTVTSAELLEERMPKNCIHQFVPLDVLPWMRRFLEHWKPDLAVWTESEIWPGTLYEVHRREIPMLLINARISEKTFRRWSGMKGMARSLLRRFDEILAQDRLAREQLISLGADPERISVSGTLKEGAAPLPGNEDVRRQISMDLVGRQIWLAASTHEGEEEVVLAAHVAVHRSFPKLALILVPRHPNRGDAVAELARSKGLRVAQRSKDEPIDGDVDVYLADTLGEMGIWYRIAPVSFVGGSLINIGGHNPFEPALLGSAVIHGPHVRNFVDAYEKLTDAGAAVEVTDEEELVSALADTLHPDRAAEMAAAAWETCSDGAEVTETVMAAITSRLDAGPE